MATYGQTLRVANPIENGWVHAGGTDLPVVNLAVTYVLLVPLLVFAVHGSFSFEYGSANSGLGAFGGKIAEATTSSESLRERLQSYLAMLLCLAPMVSYCRVVARVSRRMILMVALPLYAITSALWSQDALLSLRSGVFLLVTTFFAFYLASRFSERQQMELIMLAGGCVVLSSILLVLLWPQFGLDHQWHEGAWQGLFTQKNVCAEATLFLLTPALALSGRGRYEQLLRGCYIALCFLVILMTESRTGWAMTVLYVAFAYGLKVLGRFDRRDLLPVAALLFAGIGVAAVAALEYPTLIISMLSRSESFSGRTQIWNAAMQSILRRPIAGYGFDAFWSLLQGEASRVFAAAGWVVTSAHNGFLNVGLELGVVGLVLVAATFFQALRHATTAFHPGHSRYIDWCIGIVFLTLVYNLDERTLMATQYLPWILYIVACTGLSLAAEQVKTSGGYESNYKEAA